MDGTEFITASSLGLKEGDVCYDRVDRKPVTVQAVQREYIGAGTTKEFISYTTEDDDVIRRVQEEIFVLRFLRV